MNQTYSLRWHFLFASPATIGSDADPAYEVERSFKSPLTVGVNIGSKLVETQHPGLSFQEAGFRMLKIKSGIRSAARYDASFTGSVF